MEFDEPTDAPAGIGHNEPSGTLITGMALSTHLSVTYVETLKRVGELLAKGVDFLTIRNDAEDSEATEFMVKLRACWKAAEAARVAEKSPYDDAAGMVHAFFKTNVLDPLGLGPTDKRSFDPMARPELGLGPRINMAQTLYKVAKAEAERKLREEAAALAAKEEARRREEARKAEEEAREAERAAARKRNEAARREAEEEAARKRAAADTAKQAEDAAAATRAAATAAASATSADLSRSRGTLGGVSSLRESIDFRDLDRDNINLEALRPYFTDKALDQAVRAYADANKATVNSGIKNREQPLRGVVFYIAQKTAGRA